MAIKPIGSNMNVTAQQTQTQPTQQAPESTANVLPTGNGTAPVSNVKKENKENGNEQQGAREQDSQNVSADQVKKAVDKINRRMTHSEAVFGIHEPTNRITIKIVDKETKELIQELPPEKTLDMISKVWELAGLLVDEKR